MPDQIIRKTPSMIPMWDMTEGMARVPAPTTVTLSASRCKGSIGGRTGIEQVHDTADRGGLASMAAILVAATSWSEEQMVSDQVVWFGRCRREGGESHLDISSALLVVEAFPSDIVE